MDNATAPHTNHNILSRLFRNDLVALAGILFLAFAIRFPFLATEGHKGDMRVDQVWMQGATVLGVADSYDIKINEKIQLPNHGPVELYLYTLAGNAYQFFFKGDYVEMIQPYHRIFAKFPGQISDYLLCIFLYFLFRGLRGKKAGVIVASVFAIHPIAWHDSAYWGQTDSLYTLLILVSIVGLAKNRIFVASAFFMLALLTKPQAIIFAPIFLLFCEHKLSVYLKAAFAGLTTFFITLLPFLLNGNLISSFRDYAEIIEGRSGNRLSANAFNFWWAAFGKKSWAPMRGMDYFLDFIQLKMIGILAFCALVGIVLFICRKRIRQMEDRTEQLLLASSLIASAFFMCMTSMHERYFYPYIVFALPFLFMGRDAIRSYVLLCIFFYMNIWVVLPFGAFDKDLLRYTPNIAQYIAIGASCAFLFQFCVYLFCMPRRATALYPAKEPRRFLSLFDWI